MLRSLHTLSFSILFLGSISCLPAEEQQKQDLGSSPMDMRTSLPSRDAGTSLAQDLGSNSDTSIPDLAGFADLTIAPDLKTLADLSNLPDMPDMSEPPDLSSSSPDMIAQDQNCHVDCFGVPSCHDGVVTVFATGPIPCDENGGGSCPLLYTHQCRLGCAMSSGSFGASAESLCVESQVSKVGDPCIDGKTCNPPESIVHPDGRAEVFYMSCDAGTKTCQTSPPPVVSDYLGSCGLKLADVGTNIWGATDAAQCSTNVCLVGSDVPNNCLRQGCSAPCEVDQDCPQGSLCVINRWNGKPGILTHGFCQPGPRSFTGAGLSCPAP